MGILEFRVDGLVHDLVVSEGVFEVAEEAEMALELGGLTYLLEVEGEVLEFEISLL